MPSITRGPAPTTYRYTIDPGGSMINVANAQHGLLLFEHIDRHAATMEPTRLASLLRGAGDVVAEEWPSMANALAEDARTVAGGGATTSAIHHARQGVGELRAVTEGRQPMWPAPYGAEAGRSAPAAAAAVDATPAESARARGMRESTYRRDVDAIGARLKLGTWADANRHLDIAAGARLGADEYAQVASRLISEFGATTFDQITRHLGIQARTGRTFTEYAKELHQVHGYLGTPTFDVAAQHLQHVHDTGQRLSAYIVRNRRV
ncbi:MAG: hypothetical protein JWM98_2393 [Thermoleophilia bacterium]|nr:hypothetical protein [Thermoleophilia bacterium]